MKAQEPDASPTPALTRRPRVLVVDDKPDAADALAAIAQQFGCEARACYGAVEALATVREEMPDGILVDLAIPGVGGVAVAAGAREVAGRRALVLVAVTDVGELEDRTETALAGFHFHLVKPIDASALRPVIDALESLCHGGPWRRRSDWRPTPVRDERVTAVTDLGERIG